MMGSLNQWFVALSRREQILIGILGVLLAGVVVVYAIALPIDRSVDESRQKLADMTLQSGRIAAKTAQLSGVGEAPRPTLSGELNLLLAGEATERGFTLDRNQPSGTDRAEIAIGSARGPAFLAWLADLESRGVVAEQLSMRRNEAGNVAVTARLAKLGS